MARRADHTREELYGLTLEAARAIVETEGLRGLTARKIADRIGYSPGTIYNVFDNLDAVIVHMDAWLLDRLYEELDLPGTAGADPEQALKALARRYMDFIAAHRNLWEVLFEHRLPEGQELPDWYPPKLDRLLALIEDAIAPLYGAGDDAGRARAVRVLWSGVHGIATLAGSGKLSIITADSAMDLIDDLIANYVAGVAARRAG